MRFQPISVPLVCEGVKLARLEENKNLIFLYPLLSLSNMRSCVSVQNCLDFQKISVSRQIWLKIQTTLFSKQFLGFVHLFDWILINLSKFK